MKIKRLFIPLLLAIMLNAGCSNGSTSITTPTPAMTASEILAMTNNATASMNTLQGDMIENMSIKGQYMSSSDEENSSISISADQVDRKLYESQIFLNPHIEPVSTCNISEVYILNNWIYMYNLGQNEWIKTPLTEDIWNTEYGADEDWEIWNNSTNAQYIGMELVGGINCYKISVKPNPATISDMLNMTGLAMFSSSNKVKNCTVWIDKSTYYPLKTSLNMTLESDSMSMEPEHFTISANIVFAFSNINKPVTIVLPAEAQNATAISYSTFESYDYWCIGNWMEIACTPPNNSNTGN